MSTELRTIWNDRIFDSQRRKTALVIFLMAIAGFVFFKGVVKGWQAGPADFSNYYASARLLLEGDDIGTFYNQEIFDKRARQIGVESGARFAPFPPPTAFLFVPVAFFSELQARRIWLFLNVSILVLAMILISRRMDKNGLLRAGLLLSLFAFPLASGLFMGQVYLTIAVLSLSFYLKPNYLNASLLSTGAVVKYFPLYLLGFGNWMKNRKYLFVGALVGIVVIVIPELLYPGVYRSFAGHFSEHLQGRIAGQNEYSPTYQSLNSLLLNLFKFDEVYNPLPVVDLPFLIAICKLILTGFFGITMLVLWKKMGFERKDEWLALLVFGLSIFLPITAVYHFVLLLVPVFILLSVNQYSMRQQAMIFVLVFVTMNLQAHHLEFLRGFNPSLRYLMYPRLFGLMVLFSIFSVQFWKSPTKYG